MALTLGKCRDLLTTGTAFAPGRILGFTLSQWLVMRMEAIEKPLTEEALHSAFDLLRKLTPEHELLQFAPLGQAAVYTTLVTLWMLTLQRLGGRFVAHGRRQTGPRIRPAFAAR